MAAKQSIVTIAVVLLFPATAFAASIATALTCPVTASQCSCIFNGPFYSVKCSSLDVIEDFRAIVSNTTESAVIIEVDSAKWSFLPLDALQNSSLHTLIVGNSSFTAFSNSSEDVSNLRHLSLENVTFADVPEWQNFSSLKSIQVLFIYNTTIPTALTSQFGGQISKSLVSVSIAESNVSSIEESSFKELENLTSLRISHNKLTTFSRNALPMPAILEQLRLDYNKIHALPAGVFEDMPHLNLVSLSNNTISTLPENVFKPLWRPNMHLELRDNPIKCDCRLKWITVSTSKPTSIIGQCAFPKRLFGRNLQDLTEQDLRC